MMKNKFLFLMMFLGVALFSSCSDDDPDYTGNYSVDKLQLSLSGVTQVNKEVELTDSSITLKDVIAGENATIIPIVFDGANFSGKATNSDRTVTVAGSIKKKVLQLDVTLKITNELVGTWDIFDGNVTVKVEAPADAVLLFMGNEMTADQFENMLPMLMGSMPQAYLKDITFKDNGYLVATYDAGGNAGEKDDVDTWMKSPEGAVKWYVKNNQVYLVPDINMIMNAGRGDDNVLNGLLANGLPLNYTINDEGLHVYVTKEQMLPLMDVINGLLSTIEEKNYIIDMAKMVIPELKQDMEICTVFDLGMKMMRPEK